MDTVRYTMSNTLTRRIYDSVLRNRLPRKLGVLNGVIARRPRLLDRTDHDPVYKSALIKPLRDEAATGDTVINIGGGTGVSTVAAAEQVGLSGHVICYEGGKQYVELCQEALELNGVTEQAEVRHKIVGDDVDVWGEAGNTVSPSDLPDCDVLVMDCEGAEWSILEGLNQRPRVLVVEVHPQFDVAVADVQALLDGWGYQTSVERNDGIGYTQGEGTPVVTGILTNE